MELSSSDRTLFSLTFTKFKPICDSLVTLLTKQHTPNEITNFISQLTTTLQLLYEKIDATEKHPLYLLIDYLYIPIVLLLSPNKINPSIQSIVSRDHIQCQSLHLITLIANKFINHSSNNILEDNTEKSEQLFPPQQRQFIEIIQLLCNIIFSSSQQNQQEQQQKSIIKSEIVYNLSDEQLISVLDSVKSVYQWWSTNSTQVNSESIDPKSETFIVIAFSISTLLDLLVAKSISRQIKITTVETLSTILNILFEHKDALTNVLPATSTTLFKLITADFKVGTKLKVLSLKLFSKLVVSACGEKQQISSDDLVNQFLTEEYQQKKINTTTSKSKAVPTNSTPELSQTEKSIFRFISIIFPHSSSYSKLRLPPQQQQQQQINNFSVPLKWGMKVALVESADEILVGCANTLPSIVPILLETLTFYSLDEYEEVSNISNKRLEAMKSNDEIREILLDNFNHLVQSMPRLICGTDEQKILEEEKKEMIAQLALSYMRIIDRDSLDSFINVRMELIASILIQLTEIQSPKSNDKHDTTTLAFSLEDTLKIVGDSPFKKSDQSTRSNKRVVQVSKLHRPYLYIQTEKLEYWIFEFIREIGKTIGLPSWIDIYLSNSTLSRSPRRKEIILIINQLMIGCKLSIQQNHKGDFSTIMYILEEYLDPEMMNLPIANIEEDSKEIKRMGQDYYLDNIILQSLIIEGIGSMTSFLKNKKHQSLFISKVLYHLMEKFGVASHDSTGFLFRSCKLTFNEITLLFNYDSLEDVVYKNSDYLLDKIESNMKYLHSYPNTPNVFEGILNITGLGFLPFLKDTVQMILFSLDVATENSDSILIFIKILYNIIKVLYNNSKLEIEYNKNQVVLEQYSKEIEQEIKEDSEKQEDSSIDDIKSFFLKHHQQKEINEQEHNYWGGGKNDGKKRRVTSNPIDKDQFKVTTESQRQLLNDIIHKCKHFLGSRNRSVKMTILDIMDMGLLIVSTGKRNYGGEEDQEEEESNQDSMDYHVENAGEKPKIQPLGSATDKNPKVALFPLIHSLWPSIIKRIEQTEDRAVGKRSLELVQTITILAKDFITQRFWNDLFPVMKKIIQRELSKSDSNESSNNSDISFNIINNNSNNLATSSQTSSSKPLITTISETKDILAAKALKFTPSYKIQSIVLDSLSVLISNLKLNQYQLIEVARLTLPYLSSLQPEAFQTIAINIWTVLLERDYDTLWLLLFNLSGQYQTYQNQSPPNSSLNPLPKFQSFNQYKSNCLKLLNKIK